MNKKSYHFPFKKRGFTLIEIIMSIGIMGLISLGMAKLLDQQTKAAKEVEARAEIISLSLTVSKMLFGKRSCTETFAGQGIFVGQSYNEIKNHKGDVVVSVGNKYANGLVYVESIKLSDRSIIQEGVDKKRYVYVTLKVVFKNNFKGSFKKRTSREFPLRLEIDYIDRFIACYSPIESAVSMALKESCERQGGGYNSATKKCKIKNILAGNCKEGEVLVGFKNDGTLICTAIKKSDLCTPDWTPTPSEITKGTSFTQTDGCGNARLSTGTGCSPNWTPNVSTKNLGVEFNQTDGCGNTRKAIGTKCTPYWRPHRNTVIKGISFTQTNGCGNIRTNTGTCVQNWAPNSNTVAQGKSFIQTDSCGNTRAKAGTCVQNWIPKANTKDKGTEITQYDGCGNSRLAIGSKCYFEMPEHINYNKCISGFNLGCHNDDPNNQITCRRDYGTCSHSKSFVYFKCNDSNNNPVFEYATYINS